MVWNNWKSWKDIQDWAKKHNLKNLVSRLQLNNDAWMSSGEFGRSQTQICDTLRFTESETEALSIAKDMDKAFASNLGLY